MSCYQSNRRRYSRQNTAAYGQAAQMQDEMASTAFPSANSATGEVGASGTALPDSRYWAPEPLPGFDTPVPLPQPLPPYEQPQTLPAEVLPLPQPMPTPDSEIPETLSEYIYTPGYLRAHIGSLMRVEFLVANNTTDRVGILREVGASYIVLSSLETGSRIMCDLFSIKFVTIIDNQLEEALSGY